MYNFTVPMALMDFVPVLCFGYAAALLQRDFDNYHFEEDIRDGDIFFNYKLLSGKATTRNAIKLLEIMGYEPEIIDKAANLAERFIKTGVWTMEA